MGARAGTLAAYARAGDRFVFYEINPDVVTVAGRHFSFLRDAVARGAAVEVVVGDGRQAMAARGAGGDVVVLDAFSGDAIPAHLLTREAVAVYRGRLRESGVLLVNVANHHAALGRVVRGHAEAWGGRGRGCGGGRRRRWGLTPALDGAGRGCRWGYLPAPGVETGAGVVWTDDFAPLWPILRGW
ncbi:MAG: fused MFS/spermidine synthase [bacterium]